MSGPARYESGEKFARVFQLFNRLCDTQTGITTRTLADELEVHPRTVQRYINDLRELVGVDLEEVEGRWRVGRGSRLPAMQLDAHQAMQLLLAVRALQQMRGDRDPALTGALAQLARALNVPIVTRYLEGFIASMERRPADAERQRMERAIVDGLVQRRRIDVTYRDAAGAERPRTLHPYFIEPRPERRALYLIAHDEPSNEVRTFRLERFVAVRVTSQTFTVPDSFDIERALEDSWGIWQAHPRQRDHVVLRFDASVRDRVDEQLRGRNATVSEAADGRIEARLVVSGETEMRSWVLGWGGNVEVLAPPSLRDFVAAALRAGAALYSAGEGGS
ncbi:MAG: helix-turn-helix transcriptional regulator [Candidatus Dormibacteria bacterium]